MKKIILSLFIACSFLVAGSLQAEAAPHKDGHKPPVSVKHSKPHKVHAGAHRIKVHHHRPMPRVHHYPLHRHYHNHCANIYCPRCGYWGTGVNYYYHGDNFSFGISL